MTEASAAPAAPDLRKFIAIGDIHADFGKLWAALRSAGCATPDGRPTRPVLSGLYQVVLLGDLVHPKSQRQYDELIGGAYDHRNPDHTAQAAAWQMEELRRVRDFQAQAPGSVHIILGNHDDVLIQPRFVLGTGGGLQHTEFDPHHGGVALPPDLVAWVGGFLRELRVGGVQFAHVGPLPSHAQYDDLFYVDRSPKRWFLETPEYVEMAGLAFGVYGHTQMDRGIVVHEGYRFALVDALHCREYLEMMIAPGRETPLHNWRIVTF
ncbi:metallophosphoesterase [Deinococcus radiophilus]|uniref:Metallophosphoesterase n=1 Tax=Deinococcus radiophilus TaxID=32062 RepID=A0A3S0I4W9_9DEIO|nr:metallophosphoesterase [Deinococcus radiophilus]RTR25217.1 metallophosphoesterase [Deinococcus radiophilus]UFA50257.1 metallophosphoesterase [Deinococcus radiophilus]